MESQPRALGLYLSQLRALKGLTTSELARQLGVRRATVSEWLSGKRRPGLSGLISLLDLLQVTEAQRRQAIALHKAPLSISLLEPLSNLKDVAPYSGDLLRALRMRRGWTQERTAQAVGVAQSQVAKWETGLRWPDTRDLHTLCRVLCAREEEIVALTVGQLRLGATLPHEREGICDTHAVDRELLAIFDWPITPVKAALTDLMCLTLAAKAWRSAQRYPESVCALVDIYGTYAERLYLQERHLEAQPKSRFRRKTPEFAGSFWRQNRAEAPLRAF